MRWLLPLLLLLLPSCGDNPDSSTGRYTIRVGPSLTQSAVGRNAYLMQLDFDGTQHLIGHVPVDASGAAAFDVSDDAIDPEATKNDEAWFLVLVDGSDFLATVVSTTELVDTGEAQIDIASTLVAFRALDLITREAWIGGAREAARRQVAALFSAPSYDDPTFHDTLDRAVVALAKAPGPSVSVIAAAMAHDFSDGIANLKDDNGDAVSLAASFWTTDLPTALTAVAPGYTIVPAPALPLPLATRIFAPIIVTPSLFPEAIWGATLTPVTVTLAVGDSCGAAPFFSKAGITATHFVLPTLSMQTTYCLVVTPDGGPSVSSIFRVDAGA